MMLFIFNNTERNGSMCAFFYFGLENYRILGIDLKRLNNLIFPLSEFLGVNRSVPLLETVVGANYESIK